MEEITIKDVFTQPNGYCQIQYGELMLVAPQKDVEHALEYLEGHDRSNIMLSVNAALKKGYKRMLNATASQKEAMNYGQDCAIWYANEIFEGRNKLHETKQ